MITSKLTSKSQTTIPQAVRKALRLKPGDLIKYEITEGRAVLTRSEDEASIEDPFLGFEEWSGQNDEEAYADL